MHHNGELNKWFFVLFWFWQGKSLPFIKISGLKKSSFEQADRLLKMKYHMEHRLQNQSKV